MIEVVFGRSAYGSLKVASSYYAQGKCCGRLGAQKSGGPVVFDGQQTDIYCFSLALSIGDISDDGTGEQRRAVLRHLISVDPSVDLDEQVDESLQKTKEAKEREDTLLLQIIALNNEIIKKAVASDRNSFLAFAKPFR